MWENWDSLELKFASEVVPLPSSLSSRLSLKVQFTRCEWINKTIKCNISRLGLHGK